MSAEPQPGASREAGPGSRRSDEAPMGLQPSAVDPLRGPGAYFVVDLRAEWNRNPYITLWRPESAGYAYPLPWAGLYTAEEIEASGSYHTSRRYVVGKGHVGVWERFAVACHEVERLATAPDMEGRGRIDGNAGPVVRNSGAMRAKLRRLRYVPPAPGIEAQSAAAIDAARQGESPVARQGEAPQETSDASP